MATGYADSMCFFSWRRGPLCAGAARRHHAGLNAVRSRVTASRARGHVVGDVLRRTMRRGARASGHVGHAGQTKSGVGVSRRHPRMPVLSLTFRGLAFNDVDGTVAQGELSLPGWLSFLTPRTKYTKPEIDTLKFSF